MNEPRQEAAAQPLLISVPKIPAGRAWLAAALFSYAAGYWYVSRVWGLGAHCEWDWRWGTVLFVPLYTAAAWLAARAVHRRPAAETPLWWGCWAVQSAALLAWGQHTDGLGVLQVLAWHLAAAAYVLCRTGMQAAGRTNCMAVLDGLAGVFTLPFGNFFLRAQTLRQAARQARASCRSAPGRGRRALEIVLSVGAALVLGGAACAALCAADANFARLWAGVGSWLNRFWSEALAEQLAVKLLTFALSLPVGAWLFGLAGGGARRNAPPVTEAQAYAALGRMGRLPALTGTLVCAALCGVYALFFGVQAAEFAAALGAPLPLAAPDAAAFAVNGFWEFCRVMALNLAVLAALHFAGAKPLTAKGGARRWGLALCGSGAAFAALAAAKLAVYAALYGLTVKRMLAAWVLGVLFLASALAAVRLFRRVPAARIAVIAAALSFALLCALPLERLCVDDQLARYAAGQSLDWELLERYSWQSEEMDDYVTSRVTAAAGAKEAADHGFAAWDA